MGDAGRNVIRNDVKGAQRADHRGRGAAQGAWTRWRSTWRCCRSTRSGTAGPRHGRRDRTGAEREAGRALRVATGSLRAPSRRSALQFPDMAVRQLEDGMKKYGLRGAAIGGSVAGEEFADPKFHRSGPRRRSWVRCCSFTRRARRSWPSASRATAGSPTPSAIRWTPRSPAAPDLRGHARPLPGLEDRRGARRRLSGVLRAALRSRLLRVAGELQSRDRAEEEADRISQPALFRRAGVHAGGAAPPGGAGRRQPDRARHRSPDPVGAAPGRPRVRHRDAERRRRRWRSWAATRRGCWG